MQGLVRFYGFWEATHLYLEMLIWPKYQDRALPSRPPFVSSPMILKMSVVDKIQWSLCKPQLENLSAGPWGSERSLSHLLQGNIHFDEPSRPAEVRAEGQGNEEWRVEKGAINTSCKEDYFSF